MNHHPDTTPNASYPEQAYQFIREGLEHTVKVTGANRTDGEPRHVTGQQLCLGLKDYAVKKYGPLAKIVLSSWGVRDTMDFGRIVFDMVERQELRKTEEDSIEDFRDVYDFDGAFTDLSPSRS